MIDIDLQIWLSRIERQHPVEIDLGITRCLAVAKNANINDISTPLITVAGTNGKGSVLAFLTALYVEAGYKVGSYTSPHISKFNERIKINATMVDDRTIVDALKHIECSRENISLSYFEYSTLAAMKIFLDAEVEIILLEVGLGGRLDAVNCWDADVAVVTPIKVDHQSWLGDTREEIAPEKTAIARSGHALIVGDRQAPSSLFTTARQIGAKVICIQRDFDYSHCGGLWNLTPKSLQYIDIPEPALKGSWQIDNAAVALMAAHNLIATLPFCIDSFRRAMSTVELEGRFDQRIFRGRNVILDVGHNPAAVKLLVKLIRKSGYQSVQAVFSVMRDKAIDEMIMIVSPCVDKWYLGNLDTTRALAVNELERKIQVSGDGQKTIRCEGVSDAFDHAIAECSDQQSVLVFGSFLTVASVLEHTS